MSHLQRLQKDFVDLRFGTFIHFNSATAQFHNSPDIIDWEYDHENGSDPRKYPFDPKLWNPQQLDCRQWAAIAKRAGCRFAALTSKHHEGFALWPSKYGTHNVGSSNCKRDVVREYLEAFRDAGITAGLYFSILDLTAEIGHRSCTEVQKQYIRGQITELLTNYGQIPFLMVDGWGAPWGGPSYEMLPFEEVDGWVKAIQPDCLLMNIGCSDGLSGTDVVFFENAAGQDADTAFQGPGVSCNKLTRTWFWRDEDPISEPKPLSWVHAKMEEYFPLYCSFMLNLSPAPSGLVDDNLAQAFNEIGKDLSLPQPIEALPPQWLTR